MQPDVASRRRSPPKSVSYLSVGPKRHRAQPLSTEMHLHADAGHGNLDTADLDTADRLSAATGSLYWADAMPGQSNGRRPYVQPNALKEY